MTLDPLFLRPIAHRGLHSREAGRIENTAPAFAAAIEAGFGIECDLRPALKGLPIVFHDETLDRLVDGTGPVADLGPTTLARLRYKEQDTRILTFAEFLAQVGGRVPLLVEVKSEWEPPDIVFLSEIAQLALDYGGPLALMSFDTEVMTVLRELAPQIPRGVVSGGYKDEHGETWWRDRIDDERASRLARLQDSAACTPAFYAYHVKSLPTPETATAREIHGLPLFAWTVRSAEDWAIARTHADAPIFEGP